MDLLKRYILPRLLQWVVVVFLGVTITFIIPRLLPTDPVEMTLNRLQNQQAMDPRAVASLRSAMEDLYGLSGSLPEQYIAYWRRMLQGDLGPSLGNFPTPVMDIIRSTMPWTVGLLITATLISWLLGTVLGTMSAFSRDKAWSKVLDKSFIVLMPIPYPIFALVLVMVFCYYFPIFPMVGGASGKPALSWPYIRSIIEHGFLPAMSLILGGTAFRFIMARALASTVISSDYVSYAQMAGVPRREIASKYVLRNTMLPQITDLGLALGAVFGGALITEMIFAYPGVGYSFYNAILQADFNLMLGVTLFSIVGIATAALLVDLSYPLFDPRVRYR